MAAAKYDDEAQPKRALVGATAKTGIHNLLHSRLQREIQLATVSAQYAYNVVISVH